MNDCSITTGLIAEYMKLLPVAEKYVRLDELVNSIEAVSGYSLEKLLKLFLAGYTLKAPQNGYTAMFTIIDEMGDKND